MDPISLIVAALVGGASAGLQGTAGAAIKDAYRGFKALILRRFKGDADAEATIEAVEREPGADQAGLRERLKASGADTDEELVSAARVLLEQVDPEGTRAGKYNVRISGGKVGAIGDNAKVTMN